MYFLSEIVLILANYIFLKYSFTQYITYSISLSFIPAWHGSDINLDGNLNVLDVVMLVNHILGSSLLEDEPLCAGDVNSDGGIDVLDVVTVVNTILN